MVDFTGLGCKIGCCTKKEDVNFIGDVLFFYFGAFSIFGVDMRKILFFTLAVASIGMIG